MSTVIEPNAPETTPRNAPEEAATRAEMPLEARGGGEGESGTPGSATGQANAGNQGVTKPAAFGFTSSAVAPFVAMKLAFPDLWPDTAVRPIFFKLDYLLSGDADREQSAFLKLTADERDAETYHYDARMISFLSCYPPEGLLDFPAWREDFDPDNAEHRKELSAAVFAYLYRPSEPSGRALAFIARQVMSRYWSRVIPKEYL